MSKEHRVTKIVVSMPDCRIVTFLIGSLYGDSRVENMFNWNACHGVTIVLEDSTKINIPIHKVDYWEEKEVEDE